MHIAALLSAAFLSNAFFGTALHGLFIDQPRKGS